MRRNRAFDFLFRKQFVIAGALVLVAAFGMTALYSHNQEQERARLEQELAQLEQEEDLAKEQQEVEIEKASSVIPPKEVIEERVDSNKDFFVDEAIFEVAEGDEAPEGTLTEELEAVESGEVVDEESVAAAQQGEETQSVAVTTPNLHFPIEEGMLWPMDGNVIMNYSMDATIYHATLDQYKYNPAIIIAGAVNSKVFAVAQGQIVDISQNEVTGTTVTVDLGDGYRAIYGQLKEMNFKKGDYVEKGHVIGYVSEPTKYFSVEGSNLYFELQKDGNPIDPIAYFE